MRLEIVPIQAVKSISQRNLAAHWQSLHARSGLPRVADFSPGDRAHDPKQLLLWAVDRQNGEHGYRHLHGGAHVLEAFGAHASAESVPERLREALRSGLDACASSASMIYMSIATSDPSGNRIECERLLLPFGSGSSDVTYIIASLQLVSLEGAFHRRTIVQQFERHVEVTLRGMIQAASQRTPKPAASPAERSRTAG